MTTELNNLKRKFLNSGIVAQLIYINIAVYIASIIFNIFESYFLFNKLSLPINFVYFTSKPWTIITYGFYHDGFLHILGNLIALFYFGNLFVEYFSKKHLLNTYLFGTGLGGAFFLIGATFIPALQGKVQYLVGASAGVTAILIALANYLPNYQLRFRLIGYIKLWHIAVGWIAYNLLFILASNNTGGCLAHLGGAFFGLLYVHDISNRKLALTKFFRKIFKKDHKSKLKTIHKSKNYSGLKKSDHEKKINTILEKIGKSGYDSLSKSEKEFLFKQGKD